MRRGEPKEERLIFGMVWATARLILYTLFGLRKGGVHIKINSFSIPSSYMTQGKFRLGTEDPGPRKKSPDYGP
jgi:hypothetical protein